MKNKTNYNKTSIDKLSNEKPVVYEIKTKIGNTNYVGVAKKGRVTDRIKEHLTEIPGASVSIKQFPTISEAREAEKKTIKHKQPKYNQQGK